MARERVRPDEALTRLSLGIRSRRKLTGVTLRDMARQLGVSPSLLSQIETGKAQPSLGTLRSISKWLDVSIDALFASDEGAKQGPKAVGSRSRTYGDDAAESSIRVSPTGFSVVSPRPGNLSDPGCPGEAFDRSQVVAWAGCSVTRVDQGDLFKTDDGAEWRRLPSSRVAGIGCIEFDYPPNKISTSVGQMVRHTGSEFVYVTAGELQLAVGFDVVTLRKSDSVGFDSSLPHLLTNPSHERASGIWLTDARWLPR